MTTSLPQPSTNNNPEEDYMAAIQEARSALRRAVEIKLGEGASFEQHEVGLLEAANVACRLDLEAELQAIADAHENDLRIDGVLHERHQDGSSDYHSLCGTMHIRRPTYRRAGERNGPTVVPLELAAGLIEGATPALAYRLALGYAQGPGRHAEEQIHADHRAPPSRSTLERMAKAIGMHVKTTAPQIEPLLRKEEKLPEGGHAISIGLDRTSVPMEEKCPAGSPPTTRRKKRTKPYVRKAPPPVDVKYRMAYVGTVSVVDKDSEALTTRRYALSGAEDPSEIIGRMMADVRRAREQARLPVGIMQDGAPEMWNLMRAGVREAGVQRWHEGVDRYHLNERLAEILRIVEPEEAKRPQKLRRWNDELDKDDGAIDRIAKWLAEQIALHDGEDLKKLEGHWTFLLNNNDRMRYATLRRAGLPCGSGATEGACKSVVMIRAKGCGQRWHEDGVGAALTLRAAYMSERLPTLWPHFAAKYSSEVREAA
jgi:hypothetical protein